MIENRKNSSEIYGYDFCIDDKLGVWLIEVNSSPAWDYSSSVTERLVKMASEDYIKVVIDYNMASKKARKTTDTGLFERIVNSMVNRNSNLDSSRERQRDFDNRFNGARRST